MGLTMKKTVGFPILLFLTAANCVAQSKTGAAAYDDVAAPWHDKFVKDWQDAVEAAKKDIEDTSKRMRMAKANGNARIPDTTGLSPEMQQSAIDHAMAAKYLASPEHLKSAKAELATLQKNNPPYYRKLTVAGLTVDNYGIPDFIDAKVVQVVDADKMIVGVEDAHTADGGYRKWIMVKLPTAGITDGQFWRTWDKLIGKNGLLVSGTTTYKTAGGSSKTVPVVELLDFDSLKKQKGP